MWGVPMLSGLGLLWAQARVIAHRRARRLAADEQGATAVEFAMVGTPFLMLLFGIISVGLYFFTTFTLENAVEEASRLIRTGQAQESGMTAAQFKTEICNRVPRFVDCSGKLRVNVQKFTGFGSITATSCTDNGGNLVEAASTAFQPGASGDIVLVTVCYEWELGGKIPYLQLGDMANGSTLIQAATTFKTEPYSN